jgi:hypothetical protein
VIDYQEELERLAKRATPGPRTVEWDDGSLHGTVERWVVRSDSLDFYAECYREADADFLVATDPQKVLSIIARIRVLDGAIRAYIDTNGPRYDDVRILHAALNLNPPEDAT